MIIFFFINQINKMEELNQFLESHRVTDKNIKVTHARLNPSGKFHISSGKDLIDFYKYYNKCLKNKEKLCFLETQNASTIPVIIDIDLKNHIQTRNSFLLYQFHLVFFFYLDRIYRIFRIFLIVIFRKKMTKPNAPEAHTSS